MARSRRAKTADLLPQADPAAPLDSKAFLAVAQPVLALLTDDLLERAEAHPDVTAELRDTHTQELAARRTGESFEAWRRGRMVQVAAAWLLSCVFVRVLEDRGLLVHHRLAGPGAEDSQRQFGELTPYLGARDYLLTVFRELTRIPATAPLFDARHNLVWRLAPSHGAAQALLDLLRAPQSDAPAFRFGQSDTTFLGDLYQDISEDVRKTFALLQTPPFVQSFILDRTLEPALAEFGLDDTKLIDPTCGSGHFLLGAFARLLDHQRREHPGLPAREHALRAIRAVYGVDLNPYAVAIARFRLTLTFWEAVGLRRLDRHSAQPPLNVVVGDSLLLAAGEQKGLHEIEGQAASNWLGAVFSFDDEAVAKRILSKRFEAVVGNPPYITVKDAVLRDEYRKFYTACYREYSLSAPFIERIFLLARSGGFTGQITSNSFMKREFGSKVVEDVLPRFDLTLVVNTAGAYIPGHGTPTVLLFGRNQKPKEDTVVLGVLSKRGEPSTPGDPAKGLVWTSIVEHWHEVGFDGEYVSVETIPRNVLNEHPWSLEGGGAGQLKEILQQRGATRLEQVASSMGFMCITKQDDVFLQPEHVLRRMGAEVDYIRPAYSGEDLRDWSTVDTEWAIYPYTADAETVERACMPRLSGFMWPYRSILFERKVFGGKTFKQAGKCWYEYGQIPKERLKIPLSIAYAEVATHNHFVLDRDGGVFNRTAPLIKLHADADEGEHLALLAYLNSSTACFFLRQVSHQKQMVGGDGVRITERAKVPFAFASGAAGTLPLPPMQEPQRRQLVALAQLVIKFGQRRNGLSIRSLLSLPDIKSVDEAWSRLHAAEQQRGDLLRMMVAAQEEIDWLIYACFGLIALDTLLPEELRPLAPGQRPFEVSRYAEPEAFNIEGFPVSYPLWATNDQLFRKRIAAIEHVKDISIIEQPEFKRRWIGRQGLFNHARSTFVEGVRGEAFALVAEGVERVFAASSPLSVLDPRHLHEKILQTAAPIPVACALADISTAGELRNLLAQNSIPFLAAWRYTEDGMANYAHWEQTWALQRREDAGETVGEIPAPPKYDQEHFRDANFYRVRGKLDVPKERFISYPGCESGQDGEPIYGWAGWDHLQRADALADLYYKRKDGEGWNAERLTPILAGLLELLPWLKQWQNEPNAEGHRMGDVYSDVIDEECRALGLTREKLREWRPAAGRRRGASATSEAGKRDRSPTADHAEPGESETTELPPAKRGRKPKAAPAPVEPVPAPTPITTAPAAEPAAPPKRRGRPPKAAAAPLSLFPAEPPPTEEVPARPRGRAKE